MLDGVATATARHGAAVVNAESVHSPQLQQQSSPACPSKTRRSPEIRLYRPAGPRDILHDPAKRRRLEPRGPARLLQVRTWRTASAAAEASRAASASPVLLPFSLSMPLASSCKASRGGRESEKVRHELIKFLHAHFLTKPKKKREPQQNGETRCVGVCGCAEHTYPPILRAKWEPAAGSKHLEGASEQSGASDRERERERELGWWLRGTNALLSLFSNKLRQAGSSSCVSGKRRPFAF